MSEYKKNFNSKKCVLSFEYYVKKMQMNKQKMAFLANCFLLIKLNAIVEVLTHQQLEKKAPREFKSNSIQKKKINMNEFTI